MLIFYFMRIHLIYIYSLLLLCLVSCEAFDNYSTDPAHRLHFSQDTLFLDTVLTEVPTSTHRLMVYNRQEEALLISSIRLADSSQSGFRICVDGVRGNEFQGVEIAGNDSMYIFVEATFPRQELPHTRLMKDSILFLVNNRQQEVKLQAYAQDALLLQGTVIRGDTVIEEPRPLLIYDSLSIAPNACLTLTSGCRLFFHDGAGLHVHGRLTVEGTREHPVIFRGDRTDRLFPYLPYDRLPGQWEGIRIYPESSHNMIRHADIHGGAFGICAEATDSEQEQLTLEHSVIRQVSGNALELTDGKSLIANCELSNAGKNCVLLQGGNHTFIHCTLANFFSWNLREGSALRLSNTINGTPHPLHTATFRNCLITGSATDELYGERSDDASISFNYHFSHCLIRSVATESEAFCNVLWVEEEDFQTIDQRQQLFDFHLTASSQAIDLGEKEAASDYPTDLCGHSRLEDAAPDAGCYEFQAEE